MAGFCFASLHLVYWLRLSSRQALRKAPGGQGGGHVGGQGGFKSQRLARDGVGQRQAAGEIGRAHV